MSSLPKRIIGFVFANQKLKNFVKKVAFAIIPQSRMDKLIPKIKKVGAGEDESNDIGVAPCSPKAKELYDILKEKELKNESSR